LKSDHDKIRKQIVRILIDTFSQWTSMFEMKLDTILKVLLLNNSHVKVDPNKHCQIKNCNKVHNKLTTIERSKFENVMLQLIRFWNWYPPILVMIEDLLSYLDTSLNLVPNAHVCCIWRYIVQNYNYKLMKTLILLLNLILTCQNFQNQKLKHPIGIFKLY
jgi:hypothetical protein